MSFLPFSLPQFSLFHHQNSIRFRIGNFILEIILHFVLPTRFYLWCKSWWLIFHGWWLYSFYYVHSPLWIVLYSEKLNHVLIMCLLNEPFQTYAVLSGHSFQPQPYNRWEMFELIHRLDCLQLEQHIQDRELQNIQDRVWEDQIWPMKSAVMWSKWKL